MEKLLSIIIPHYNSTDSLKNLIESIEKEAFRIDVFIVDDHSEASEKKRLNELVRNINSKKNDYILLENHGKFAGGARNTALNLLSSKWVIFADADDYFTFGWYEIVSKYYQSESDLVFFLPTSFNLSNQKIGQRHRGYQSALLNYTNNKSKKSLDKVRMKIYPPWSKLIKSEFVKENDIRFDEVIASNDIMFSIKIGLSAKNIDVSKENIYCVTEGENTLTTKPTLARIKSRIMVMKEANDFLKQKHPYYFKRFRFYAFEYSIKAKEKLTAHESQICIQLIKKEKIPLFPAFKGDFGVQRAKSIIIYYGKNLKDSLMKNNGEKMKAIKRFLKPTFVKHFVRKRYKSEFGKKLNLRNPRTFSEKIQYLKLNIFPKSKLVGILADKYGVRDYVKKKELAHILTPIIGVYDRTSEISFESLPKSFVAKKTNASGYNLIVQDKNKIEKTEFIQTLEIFLNKDFGVLNEQKHYSKGLNKIIIEPYLEIDNEYNFFVFNGKVALCGAIVRYLDEAESSGFQVGNGSIYSSYFDENGDFAFSRDGKESRITLPYNYPEMVEIAEKLAEGFPFIRIDLYLIKEEIYLSEFTFTPTSGYNTRFSQYWQEKLGDLINLKELEPYF